MSIGLLVAGISRLSVVGAGVELEKFLGNLIELGGCKDVLAWGERITVIRILGGAELLKRAGRPMGYYVAVARIGAGVGVGHVEHRRTGSAGQVGIEKFAEVALPLARRRHTIGAGTCSIHVARFLNVPKIEEMILNDG
jgi:hypothetical protein